MTFFKVHHGFQRTLLISTFYHKLCFPKIRKVQTLFPDLTLIYLFACFLVYYFHQKKSLIKGKAQRRETTQAIASRETQLTTDKGTISSSKTGS